jgi:hypothetical protein
MFKKRLIIFVAILSLISIVYVVFNVFSSKKTSLPTQNRETSNVPVDLSKILPGTTTRQEVVGNLGEPNKTTKTANSETLYYNSTGKTRDSQITIENGIVVLVKEMVSYLDPKKASDVSKPYGVAIYSLFGPDSAGGNKLYVYPDKGVAYLGDPKFDTLEEIWYFTPTSIENFMQKWASNYSETEILNLY